MIQKFLLSFIGKFPLRFVIVVPFVTIISLSVGLTGYLSFVNGQIAINDIAGQLRKEVVKNISSHLKNFLSFPIIINKLNMNALGLNHSFTIMANQRKDSFETLEFKVRNRTEEFNSEYSIFGEEALYEIFLKNNHLKVDEIVDESLTAIYSFVQDQKIEDDIVFIGVEIIAISDI